MLALALAVAALGVAGDDDLRGGPTRWFGLAFGAAAITCRTVLGDPLSVERTAGGREARYWLPPSVATSLIVTERGGAIVGLAAQTEVTPSGPLLGVEADPLGISLGMTPAEVVARRPGARPDGDGDLRVALAGGLSVDYRFAAGRLVADVWSLARGADAPRLADALELFEPAADGPTTAVLVLQASRREGALFERLYAERHRCAAGTSWRLGSGVGFADGGRRYERVPAVCPATGATRTFTFDVTAFARD